MNPAPVPDFTVQSLILNADPVVQGVMAMLVLASLACWAIIIEKSILFGRLKREARSLAALAFVVAAGAVAAGVAVAQPPVARQEGLNLNSFVKTGPVAAHVLLRSGMDPRLIVAFPAGNSGVGLWFARTVASAEWAITEAPRPITRVPRSSGSW